MTIRDSSDARNTAMLAMSSGSISPTLFGGGFGFYRGGYYRQGGPVGIGGIVGLILVVLVIGWLAHGHIGSLYL